MEETKVLSTCERKIVRKIYGPWKKKKKKAAEYEPSGDKRYITSGRYRKISKIPPTQMVWSCSNAEPANAKTKWNR